MSNLLMRILTAIVFAAIALFLTWEGGFIFALFAWCVGGLVLYEWRGISKSCWRQIDEIIVSVAYIIFGILLVADFSAPLVFAVIFFSAIILALVAGRKAGWVTGGYLYATLPVLSLTYIRGEEPFGFGAIVFLFAIVWGTDIAAYFNGRSLGGPKLAPKFSPNKTWSGAIGGALAGTAGGCLVAFVALDTSPANFFIPILSLALSIVSQIGDISESWVKRHFGVKDSGHFLPGHGGFMDRVDGLVFAAILLYFVGAIAADMTVPSNMFNLI